MFAERVAEEPKEEPSMLRKALRAIMPAVANTLTTQQNIEPQDDLSSPQPDGIDKTGYRAPISAYGDPNAKRGKRDIRAEAAKKYAFLKNLDFDVVEAPDEKSGKESDQDAADLFTPAPGNKTGRQQLRIYKPDRMREVDVAHVLLQRDPEMDKVLKKLSPKMIKDFGGEDKMRYFMARHAVGGYSPEEEAEMALDTANTPLKELAYLRNYARTGKTVSPVDELKVARGQTV